MVDHNLCKAMGLDNQSIQDRIRLLELNTRDKEVIEKLHRFVIDPHLDKIVDEFYEYIMSHHEFRTYIQDAAMVAKLTRTFRTYLTTLGIHFDTLEYFNDRLRVGIAHHRIYMPLMLYECAYRKLQELLLARIPTELDEQLITALSRVVDKIVSLDITLTIDSYNLQSLKDYEGEIRDLSKKEEQMKRYASIDPLTRIRNRGALLDQLRKVCADKTDYNDYSLIMLDVDNLRQVNDRYGHLVGDYLLKLIVDNIKTVIAKGDIFARYGGDEFIILLKNRTVEEALLVARQINKIFSQEKYRVGSDELSVSISQGLSKLNKSRKIIDIIRRVDEALIKAKQKQQEEKIVVAGVN